ncbi:non-ribosomal peptide synthetase [Burkholderia guangdongensis]|uniref:non-ribosomal peptide synthetase n=1 Tax=Burkholderia guangdongensis TaxID=1792500 RepID=UPI0015CAC2C0|nr:non-ribosomal peptide synthetase [Burkholderia guangdongensis]
MHASRASFVSAHIQPLLSAPIAGREDTNLIELGLDSLHIMRLVNEWRRMGINLTFAQLVERPFLHHWQALFESARGNVPAQTPAALPATRPAADGEASGEPFGLTDVQHAYWIGRQDGQSLGGVGCHAYLEIEGRDVEAARLGAAWKRLHQQHAMLRARFAEDGTQRICDDLAGPELVTHDLRLLPVTEADARLLAIRERLSHRRLDVANGEVAGLELSLLPDGRTCIHFDVDLLVADVQSLHILLRDLATAYQGNALQADPGWRFSRYLEAEAARGSEPRDAARAYWQAALAQLPAGPRLPLVKEPGSVVRPRFVRRSHLLPNDKWQTLRGLAARHGVTPAMMLATAYAEILGRWSQEAEFTLNLPLFDRKTDHPGIEHVVADFTNLLLLRCDCRHPASFANRALDLQRQFHRDVAHASYSAVDVQRDLVRHGFAEGSTAPVVFACNLGTPLLTHECKATLGDLRYMVSQTPQVWLDHQVYEDKDGLLLAWDAVDELFPEGLLDDMFDAYRALLDWLARDADHWQHPMPRALPDHQACTRAATCAPSSATTSTPLHQRMFTVAADVPERIAVILENATLSYGELARRARQVAALLLQRGIEPGEPVAISLPRGVEQAAAVFGVLAAGGCYVPVGMSQPAARQARIHEAAGVRWVLTDTAGVGVESREGTARLDVATAWELEPAELTPTVPVDRSAYIIFTSGSTGEPKGVEVTHAAAANTIDTLNARYRVGPASRVLAVSSLDFDLSVYDLFGLLSVGGAVVLLDEDHRRDAAAWLELIHRHRVTVWNSVPVLLDMLLVMAADDPRPLPFEQVFLSGDWIGLDLPERLFARTTGDTRLVAMGGATEAAIWSNAFDVTLPLPAHWRSIPYGKPLANQRYRVVDAQGRDCPDWVPGELWIGGAGVAVGYRGDPRQTAERFVEHLGERWYRTGDLGRYWPDGNLEFLGRRDHQVKVRGHRIELGEIEAALASLPGVARAVALTVGQPAALAAAFVPGEAGAPPAAEELTDALRRLLPDYMVPAHLLAIEALPLSANGKVDRKMLVSMLAEGVAEPASTLTDPGSDNEILVAGIWSRLLGVEQIGRESSFFALGGDSLLATRFIAALRDHGLGADQPLQRLFARPRLKDFAADLIPMAKEADASIVADPAHRHAPFPLTEVQRAYWMGQSPGLPLNSGTHYLLELDGADVDLERMEQAWNRLIRHHEMMRAVVDSDGQQRILPHVPIQRIVLSHVLQHGDDDSALAAQAHLQSCWRRLTSQRDSDAEWPPFEIHAVAYGERRHRIGILLDYLTLDGYSIKLLLEQLAELYADPLASLPVPEISFRDYVLQVHPSAQARARSEAFWRAKLADLPHAPALPVAVDPVKLSQPHFFRREARIPRTQWSRLKERARAHHITPSVLLLVAYSQIIRRWSGDADFTLNLTLFDRQNVHPDVGAMLGDFTSLAPVAFRAANGSDMLAQARATQLDIAAALEHREVSSIWVQRERARETSLVAAALPIVFTSTLGLGGGLFEAPSPGFPRLVAGGLSATPQVWLDHQLYEYDGELSVSWDAVDDLFPPGMLDDMFAAYVDLLHRLVDDEWTQPMSVPLPAQQAKARAESEPSGPPSSTTLLHAGMFAIAAREPDRTALIADGKLISYGVLAERALRIAAQLQLHGMQPGDAVAVTLPRGVDQVCAVFGILAAGGCYVPVGMHQPATRQAKIHATAGIRWILGERAEAGTDQGPGPVTLAVAAASALPALPAPLPSSSDASAYIIFTSGSTGEPKGVEVTHAAAANTIDTLNARYRVGPASRGLAVSSLDFDLSVYDLFGLLSVGGTVVLPDEDHRRDAAAWLDLIHRHRVTVWNSVPVLLDMLLVMAADDPRPLPFEQVFLSGDWIGLDLPERLFARTTGDTRLVAMGGATEAAIWSNAFDVTPPLPAHWRSIPYGKPLANQRYRVVDAQGMDCPDWVPGELWIGGAGVAVGYRGDPRQTAERFVEHLGERWYRTGDLGRYWPDGNLEFLGRRDHQVKVRGHRIELGEIEAALASLPGVARAVALTVGQPAALAAAFVPSEAGAPPAAEALTDALRQLLPDYMVPAHLLAIEALPLSSNGKVDRSQVADLLATGAGYRARELTPPTTDNEVRVAKLWRRLLGTEQIEIGRESSFFALGGDSLLATRLIAALREQGLGAEQPLRLLFAQPRLMDFAAGLAPVSDQPRTRIVAEPGQRYRPFPLTEVQRAYWMGRSPGLPLNCGTHFMLALQGAEVDLDRLQRACNRLLARHDMLRVTVDGDGLQRILPVDSAHPVDITDCVEPDAERASENLQRWWHDSTRRATRSVLRAHVVRHGDGQCRLGLLFDYLSLDGYSIKLLVQELAELYRAPDCALPEIGLSFRDYVTQVQADPVALQRAEDYWRPRLADLPPAAQLTLACDPRELRDVRFKRRTSRLEQRLWSRIKEAARRQALTPSVFVLAAYGEILSRWSGGDAHTINLTMFDRKPVHADIARLVGDFTTLAPVTYRPTPGADLRELAGRMQSEIAEVLEHRAISSIWVQRERARGMGLAAAALPIVFTSTLGMSDARFDDMHADGFPDLAGGGLSETPQVWLDHQMYEHRGELWISWDAVDALFPVGMLDEMFSAFLHLLEQLADTWPQPSLLRLPSAQADVRDAANRSDARCEPHLLHAGLFAMAACSPDRPALLSAGDSLSYGELADKALRIASLLRRHGIRPGEPVAVSLPRGIDQVCAVFGVLAAGGCYVPVGVSQPAARQARIHRTAGIRWVLTDAEHSGGVAESGAQALDIQQAKSEAPLSHPVPCQADASAYIIFTSGSTGEPKGVEVTHAAAANTIDTLNARYRVGPASRGLAVSSLDFDLSVYDLFGLLSVGGTVVLPDEDHRRDAAAWLDLIHRHRVTVWNSVPVLLDMLLVMAADDPRPLPFEQVFLSGDWIGLDLPERLFAKTAGDTRLVAMGGATEAAIWSNAFDVTLPLPAHWRSIPYGKPLANQRYRVVDAQGRDCPDWVPGELWIGGAGVAVGYRGDPRQTAERFVEHLGERWYRTGDLGRYWPDGNLEFLGRRDHQVKVRGHRIELGEIEAALASLPGVARAVVLTVGQPAALAAAFVPSEAGAPPAAEELTDALRRLLPDYMVPAHLLAIEALPLSTNGKVDRHAVAALLAHHTPAKVADEPPLPGLERQVSDIWKEVLACERLSRTDDFFLIGGDSLRATQIVQRLHSRRVSPAPVPLFVLFSSPTVAALADHIREQWQALGTTAVEDPIEEGIL